jgi:hypothetical protein
MSQNAKDSDSHIGRRLEDAVGVRLFGDAPCSADEQPGDRVNALALSFYRARRSRQRRGHPDVQAAEFGRLAVLRSRRHGKKLSVPWQFDNVPQVKLCVVRQPGHRIGRLVLGIAYGEFTGQQASHTL